eukprot:3766990-Ditylum_brightwellii.AAC.1
MFQGALWKCKVKPAVDKTWNKFKKFFVDEYAKLHEEEHLMTKELQFQQADVILNVSTALDNLASAAIAERNTMQGTHNSKNLSNKSKTTRRNSPIGDPKRNGTHIVIVGVVGTKSQETTAVPPSFLDWKVSNE